MLKRFDIESAKPFRTLISLAMKIDLDEGGNKVDVTLYECMIGSLL